MIENIISESYTMEWSIVISYCLYFISDHKNSYYILLRELVMENLY